MNKGLLLCAVVLLTTGLIGCQDTSRPTAAPTAKPLPPPAATAAPTDRPPPTATLPPTPTATAAATSTPEPTPPPTEPPPPTLTPTPAATPTPEVTLTPIGQITAERVGEEVTVEGTVVDAESFSAGFKFTLRDNTGEIALLMWHNVYDDCWDAAEINLGATVRASGEIGQYEQELQIEPSFGGDVKAIEGAYAWAPSREIGSLSEADEGQRVMIEGQVVRTEGLSSAVKVFVGDETGVVMVFIWRTILDRIPENTGLGTEGTQARIVGTVKVYNNMLEVAPTLPYDVVVLRGP